MRLTKVSIFTLWVILFIAGCSTTNHAPLPTMVYHDITGHYNAYFNANEKLKGVYLTLDKLHKDNYKDILPLYTYSDPKEATSAAADLDDIEKRLTKSIQIHKVSNYADDDFLMMGKAKFIKGDYDKAVSFFKYLTTEYKTGVDYVKEMKKMGKTARPSKKKKPVKKPKFVQQLDAKGNLVLNKVDERPSYSWWVHEPARPEALLWLAKTYAAQKKYEEASAVIQYVRSDDKFYKDLDRFVEITDAEILLRQKNYHDAIMPLEKFVGMTKKKSYRVRPLFILAQIYEQQGNFAKASDYYKEVLKNRPNYDMEFYAKIRRARLGKKGGNSDEIKKLLAQMSRDGKYKDYLDQIYYQLGEIALAENNRPEARRYFHRSISSSTKNADQKALSYVQLGKMDFEEEIYVSSKFYYDTALISMSKTDSAYDFTQTRDKTLDKLVTQISIISAEDSLQRIAKMSPADRKRFINRLLDQKQKEEDEKQSGKAISLTDFMKPVGGNPVSSTNVTSDEAPTFYFYNIASRSSGYSEFIKRWGNRKLEENWRRKDKSASTSDANADADSSRSKTGKEDGDTTKFSSEDEKLLAGLPMTADKMDKSNVKLVEAYYALGTVYKDDLHSYRKSINAYEEMEKRFPKNKLELEAYYQLYLDYDKTRNTNKAEYYKNLILTNYPNSTIAKYLTDPAFLAESKQKENSLSTYYEAAYHDYAVGQYASAAKKISSADAEFKENKLKAKFDLLNAMIQAKENMLGEYVQSLNKIITKYPGTPEKDQAKLMLDKLNSSKLPQIDISKLPKDSSGDVIMPEITKTMLTPALNDTAGQAAFLAKMHPSKPSPPKADETIKGTKDISEKSADTASAPPAKPYKPLSRGERIDSIMKAEKGSKSSSTIISSTPAAPSPTSTPTPTPTTPSPASTKASTDTAYNGKPYKPLSRTERMDSIMKAERAAKNKNQGTVISSTPTAASTAKNATTPAPPAPATSAAPNKGIASPTAGTSDTTTASANSSAKPYKPLSRTERMDSIMKAEKAAKNKSTTTIISKPDTAGKKAAQPKPLAKDTVAKKPVNKEQPKTKPEGKDSIAAKALIKPATAPFIKPAFDIDTLSEVYGKSETAPHYVIIYFYDVKSFSMAGNIVSGLDSLNKTSFSSDNLTARSVTIDADNKLIYVKGLTNKDKATAYLTALRSHLDKVMGGVSSDRYFLGSISMLNYSTLLSTKKINNYARFYRINYK